MTPTYDDAQTLPGLSIGNIIELASRRKNTTGIDGRLNATPRRFQYPQRHILSGVFDLVMEVRAELGAGRSPTVRLFVGAHAVERAGEWRLAHGTGSALALPTGVDPNIVPWPPVSLVAVIPEAESECPSLERAQALAGALRREGVGYAAIPHEQSWPNLWPAHGVGGSA